MKKEIAMFLAIEGALAEAVTSGVLSLANVEPILNFSQDAYARLINGEEVEAEGFPELSSLEASATTLINKVEANYNATKQGYPNA